VVKEFLPWFSPIMAMDLGTELVMAVQAPVTGPVTGQDPVPITAMVPVQVLLLVTGPGPALLLVQGPVRDN